MALYNVEVEGHHTYYAGDAGLLAHNGLGGGGGPSCNFPGAAGASDAGISKVPVRELRGRQLRSEYSGSNIKRLKKSMTQNGFDENTPIDIAEVDGRKIIIDGHHRARAAGAAGIREVPVRVIPVTPGEGTKLLGEAAEAAQESGLPF